jgi:hypothetical protein
MTPDDFAGILRAGDDHRRDRTPACPDEQRIAAFADGLLGPEDRAQVELHLADCAHCLAMVGLLGREGDNEPGELVPEVVLARIQQLDDISYRSRWRSAPRWAAAASLLLAIPVLLQLSGPPGGVHESQSAPEARVKRSATVDMDTPEVLLPVAGATVEPDTLRIRWTAIPGSDYYDLRIVTDAGALVVEQRVTGTEWRPTQATGLARGAEYYVHVDAYPADGKVLSSVHVPFRTAE